MSLPAYDGSAWAALVLGILFGLALEGGGLGSPRKLTAQFTFRDFTVLKVMLTAVVTCALGLWLLRSAGIVTGGVYIPTPYYWAFLAGGALIGAGFAVGGYCPGTSTVGFAAGRLDALVFMADMVAGVGLFAGGFSWLEPFYTAAQGPERQTMDGLLGLPAWAVILAVAGMTAAVFAVGGRLERKLDGPISASDLVPVEKNDAEVRT
ncbi:MAG: DUF6691 family protein [Rhodovibrionaceae bacterium]|nr:DUF6691 family protein [Rhodovibrionaceae bacterium]